MIDFKHVPIKRQYTEKELLYDVLGALNRALCELNLAVMNCEDYELNDSRLGKIVKNDVERVMEIVRHERDAIKRQIELLEATNDRRTERQNSL